MNALADWCAGHLAKPSVVDPLLDRALGGISRIEGAADELRSGQHRQDVVLAQLQAVSLQLRDTAEALDAAAEALGVILQALMAKDAPPVPPVPDGCNDRDQVDAPSP